MDLLEEFINQYPEHRHPSLGRILSRRIKLAGLEGSRYMVIEKLVARGATIQHQKTKFHKLRKLVDSKHQVYLFEGHDLGKVAMDYAAYLIDKHTTDEAQP